MVDFANITDTTGKALDAAQLAKVQEYAKDGFTAAELADLEKDGVDIGLLQEGDEEVGNVDGFDKAAGADKAADGADKAAGAKAAGTATEADIEKKVNELKQKYSAEAGGGDPYTMSNPQMEAFKKAIDDGVLKDLAAAGFDKLQIVDVISQVFPSIGIAKGENGGYTLPMGHDTEASELYNKFSQEIAGLQAAAPETKALNDKLAGINFQIQENNHQLAVLKPMIEKLQKQIEEKIEDAIKNSEEIAEDQKEAANDAVKAELKKYTEANGEMSYEKFQSNLREKLGAISSDGSSKLADTVSDLLEAEGQMTILKGYVGRMGALINANNNLSNEAAQIGQEIDDAIAKAPTSGEADCDAQRCDPIGFQTADGTRYDFFVDKDNDGNISNEKEFLGAENGWDEMAALDTNGDGKVTGDEMKGLKMVVTNADGSQEVKDASDVFDTEEEAIDLNSYKSVNQDMENGNTLLGTFSANVNGEEITDGYNTLDKVDWLDANYNFSDKDKGINRFEKEQDVKPVEADDYNDDHQAFQNNIVKLEGEIKKAWKNIGVERDELADAIEHGIQNEGEAKAKEINAKIQKNAKMPEAKEEPEAPAAKAADAADVDPVPAVEAQDPEKPEIEIEEN